eukprot:UN04463
MPKLRFQTSALVKNEFRRIDKGQEHLTAIDTDRQKVMGPTKEQIRILSSWKSAVENVYTRLAEAEEGNINLELLKRYGVSSWKIHAEQLTNMKNWMDKKFRPLGMRKTTYR